MQILVRLLFTIFLTFSLSLSAHALPSQKDSIQPALWQVEHHGTTSYLFGSIHVGKESWYPLPPSISTAFDQSSTLVVELNSVSHSDAVQQAMALPHGTTLQQQLTPETFKKLTAFSVTTGVPLDIFNPMKPWAAAAIASVIPYMKQGLVPQFGIDVNFIEAAAKINMPIKELETIEFQLNMLEQLFKEESSLIEVLEMPSSAATQLIEYWQRGDIAAIGHLTTEQTSEEQLRLMLTDRNLEWLTRIRGMLQGTESHFIVVGAAHLAGEKGLPALLTEQGFKVKRVNP